MVYRGSQNQRIGVKSVSSREQLRKGKYHKTKFAQFFSEKAFEKTFLITPFVVVQSIVCGEIPKKM